MALEPKYSPAGIEAKWSEHWEASGAFKCGQRPEAEPYTIVMPPPNVTGSLHVGHALDNTLQDSLIRFERMRGKDVLWQPGVDHAGIATQMVVERQLAEEGINRRDMGREAFLERVWQWKEESGGTITRQLRRLGASCDWSRERFTMDEGFSRGVLKEFVSMYRAGLLYRDKRLVNWDPKLLTAISDLEVNQEDRSGHLWYFRYPIEGEDGRFVTVATTRPETMLGDTAVAVHPDDERYTDLVGKHVILPLAERRIPIIADEWADPEQGSGAVKITPAHDFNDFEVGKRHGLEMINIFDAHAALNDNVPEAYRGLDRFEARKRVVADLEGNGLVERIEPHHHTLPVGDRSGVAIEPWLTDQWYVNAEELAKAPIKAVEEGKTRFIPKRWEKVFFEWMRNIQPWCVSRQLWWGHQIPAWYAEDGSCFVAETEEEAYAEARETLGDNVTLTRDEDVLDTWFSSALWPFGTLGWPDETPEVARYYPNSVLITAFDIIFFWVARMMMSGMFLMKEVPFRDVYIHALICDEFGQKMSKSKGNTVDPLEFVDKYGADALRFTLAQAEAQGRDIRLSEARVEGARNFGTKLWNAARLLERNTSARDADGFDPAEVKLPLNRWIVGACRDAAAKVTQALEAYRFNETADAAYHFAWHVYCDWFLELMKVAAGDEAPADEAAETRATARWTFDQILKLLHPIMPFVTEELWHALDDKRESDLILASWPELGDLPEWREEADEIDWLIRLITEIRAIRSELNVPAAAEITAYLKGADETARQRLEAHAGSAKWLARLTALETDDQISPEGAAQSVLDGATLILPLEGIIDFAEERTRLEKAIAKADGEIGKLETRLANPDYRKKAPADVVAKAEAALADEKAARDKLSTALKRLG